MSKSNLSDALKKVQEIIRWFDNQEEVDVEKGLEKIKEGSYGLCVDCGNSISEKRLLSFPDTTRCLGCQEIFEDKSEQGSHYTI